MNVAQERKQRLENLLHLARIARNWSRAKLARALGRDPTKLVPESGNPKMDYIVALAEVLEWPVGDVVDAIWKGSGSAAAGAGADRSSFENLNEQVLDAVREADFHRVVELSERMFELARTNDERAHACIREAAGWDGLGRYPRVLDATRRGLGQGPLSLRLRLALQATLANAQYTLWDLTPALGTTEVLANWYAQHPPEDRRDMKRVAYVHYVRGNTRRRLMCLEPENSDEHQRAGEADLIRARDLYESLAEELGDDSLRGIANTCRAGLIEIGVERGDVPTDEAVRILTDGLDRVVDLDAAGLTGDWIESYGWWSIIGSNIAIRHLKGRDLQQAMAVFTNKALEIADRLDNWAMRERVFTMQFALHQTIAEATGLELQYSIDDEERSLITSTMGRFPNFRPVGWRILETARVVKTL